MCSIGGIAMPSADVLVADVGTRFACPALAPLAGFFFGLVFFLAAGFFEVSLFVGAASFATGFAGIGVFMPGIFICAVAGVDMAASASALVAANNFIVTESLLRSGLVGKSQESRGGGVAISPR